MLFYKGILLQLTDIAKKVVSVIFFWDTDNRNWDENSDNWDS